MATIDLTQEDGDAPAPAPVVTDLTQEDSDDEPPAKRAKAPPRTLQLRTHPNQLPALWRDVGREGLSLPVIPFYGHTHGTYACFSNFFASPFDFTLPACCSTAPRTLRVAFGKRAL